MVPRRLHALADAYAAALRRRLHAPRLDAAGNRRWLARLAAFQRRLERLRLPQSSRTACIVADVIAADLAYRRDYVLEGWIYEDINGTDSLLHTVLEATAGDERRTLADWRSLIASLRRAPRFAAEYIALLGEGIRRGRTAPREAVLSALESLAVLAGERPHNPLLSLETELGKFAGNAPHRRGLLPELRRAVRREALPAHARLRAFVADTYLPHASRLGGNRERYLGQVRRHLGEDHPTPEALASAGDRELERLERALGEALRAAGIAGPIREAMARLRRGGGFLTAEALFGAVRQELAKSAAPLDVRLVPIPAHQAATIAAQYVGFGEAACILQLNTTRLLREHRRHEVATLLTHEVLGGHHRAALQVSSNVAAPDLLRWLGLAAFDEGWAVYAEQRRDELGGFTARERIGHFAQRLLRAARLRVDVGLHTGTLSPAEGAAYLCRKAHLSARSAHAEVQRYIDQPAQALAYEYGRRRFVALRRRARAIAGRAFVESAFEARVLALGALPFARLEAVVLAWAKRRRRSSR